MKKLILKRVINQPDVTLGLIKADKFIFHTLELPWRDNKRNVSCIPDGNYICNLNNRNVYEVMDVPNRSSIQIHIGNIAPDVRGCILLGMRYGTITGKLAVLSSTAANKLFKKELNYEDFELEIITC